jgi:hypothetical protein
MRDSRLNQIPIESWLASRDWERANRMAGRIMAARTPRARLPKNSSSTGNLNAEQRTGGSETLNAELVMHRTDLQRLLSAELNIIEWSYCVRRGRGT